jgi:hypothetical protein
MAMPPFIVTPATRRREFIRQAGALALAATPLGSALAGDTDEGIMFAARPRPLVRYPGKRPLILVHSRPPHFETPFTVFNDSVITPNDAFFVRYHLADFPDAIDPVNYRLAIKGAVNRALSLSLADLKTMPGQVELVAPSTSARAIATAIFRPRCSVRSWVTAPWATRAGPACRSRQFWSGPACWRALAR